LVPDGVRGERGRLVGRREGGDRAVAPQPQQALGRRYLQRQVVVVGHERGTAQRVLRLGTVQRRGEPRVPPGTRPLAGGLVVDRVVPGVLVADQRPVAGVAAVLAGGVVRLPVRLVAAEEGQVHAGVPGRLHIGPLGAGPVLV